MQFLSRDDAGNKRIDGSHRYHRVDKQFAFLFSTPRSLHLRIQISWRSEERFRCSSRGRIPLRPKTQHGKLESGGGRMTTVPHFPISSFSVLLRNITPHSFFSTSASKSLQKPTVFYCFGIGFSILLWLKLFFFSVSILEMFIRT